MKDPAALNSGIFAAFGQSTGNALAVSVQNISIKVLGSFEQSKGRQYHAPNDLASNM
jgi:hypothetical protein